MAGLPYEEAAKEYPLKVGKKPHERLYEQESTIDFRARAETAFSRIISEFPNDKRIAVVSHGGMINMLFRAFLKLPVITEVGYQRRYCGPSMGSERGEKKGYFHGKERAIVNMVSVAGIVRCELRVASNWFF